MSQTDKPERTQCPICGRKVSTPEICECSDNKYWVEQGKISKLQRELDEARAGYEFELTDMRAERDEARREVSGGRVNVGVFIGLIIAAMSVPVIIGLGAVFTKMMGPSPNTIEMCKEIRDAGYLK